MADTAVLNTVTGFLRPFCRTYTGHFITFPLTIMFLEKQFLKNEIKFENPTLCLNSNLIIVIYDKTQVI